MAFKQSISYISKFRTYHLNNRVLCFTYRDTEVGNRSESRMQRAKIYVIIYNRKRPSAVWLRMKINGTWCSQSTYVQISRFPVRSAQHTASFFFYGQSVLHPRRILHARAKVENSLWSASHFHLFCYFKKGISSADADIKGHIDRFRRRQSPMSRRWKRFTRRIHENCDWWAYKWEYNQK